MSVLSGIATAPGLSALLNSPRDANTDLRRATGDVATQVKVRQAGENPRVSGKRAIERAVAAFSKAEAAQRSAKERPAPDSRYAQFMKAVQALRLDYDLQTLTPDRVADLKAAAREIFMMDDGVPGEVRPAPADPKAAEDQRQEAAAKAAEREDRARDAARREAEAAKEAQEAARQEVDTVARAAEDQPEAAAPVASAPQQSRPPAPEMPESAPLAVPEGPEASTLGQAAGQQGDTAVRETVEAGALGPDQAEVEA